jgi:lipase chaperone LimK
MNPVMEVVLIQIVQQVLATVIAEMQKAGMTPEQQAAMHAALIGKLRTFEIPKPPAEA